MEQNNLSLSAALYGKPLGLSNQILLSGNKFPLFLSDELQFPTKLSDEAFSVRK
jgi:hypothetical protein